MDGLCVPEAEAQERYVERGDVHQSPDDVAQGVAAEQVLAGGQSDQLFNVRPGLWSQVNGSNVWNAEFFKGFSLCCDALLKN